MIEQLPLLIPDEARARHTLARCREQLERRRAAIGSSKRYTVERNAMLGFGVLYLSLIALNVMHVLVR